MAASVTPISTGFSGTTLRAMKQVFELLDQHFDGENGCYLHDYSDDRIAKETGLAPAGVKNARIEGGYGKIRPPSELALLQAEIVELQGLFLKAEQEIKDKIKDLTTRMRSIEKRFD